MWYRWKKRTKRKYHEEKFTRLEETRKTALEMAQEEDAQEKESSKDAQEVIPAQSRFHYNGGIG